MPKKRNFNLFLVDILEAIGNIKEYTAGMWYEEFIQDKKTRDAEWNRVFTIQIDWRGKGNT